MRLAEACSGPTYDRATSATPFSLGYVWIVWRALPRPLLLQIARCPNLGLGACAKVAAVQAGFADRQVPEPWNGDLAHAPILFVSSNPSISEIEDYPSPGWTDDAIADFFEHRYGRWMADGTKGLRKDGTRGKANPFLSSVRKTAERLLDRPPVPGIDYAVTEVVHCKSKAEEGVSEALNECTRRYLGRILEAAGAEVVVVLGDRANVALGARPIGLHASIELGGRPRLLLVLPHPNARRERRVDRILPLGDLERVRRALR